jgi:hypothetical protein
MHGPVLARNPALADYLLSRVVGTPLPECDVQDQAALRSTYLNEVRGWKSRRLTRAWLSGRQ